MSPVRLVSLVLLTFLVSPRLAALAQPSPPSPAPKRTPAEELLDRSLDKLASLRWLETTFKHKVNGKGVPYEAEGRHIVAFPEKKVAYEMRVKIGGGSGSIRIQCDGHSIWRIIQNGAGKPAVNRYTLKDLEKAREGINRNQLGPEKAAQLLRDDDSEHGFLGIQPALLELQEKVAFPQMRPGVLPGDKPVFVLEGEWTKAFLDKVAPPKKEGASGPDLREAWTKRTGFARVPRSCKLYLGRENFWPYRIEWYGPLTVQGEDELLTSIEFGEPTLDKPSADLDVARVFQPTEEEREAAVAFNPREVIEARAQNLLRLQRMQDEPVRDKSLLDPTSNPLKP